MPESSRYAASLMVRSASENANLIEAMIREYQSASKDSPNTDFIDANKDQAKELSISRYLRLKYTHTGRFGAKKSKSFKDSISALDKTGDVPGNEYFDPFSLKIITEPGAPSATGGDTGAHDADDESAAQKIEDDFVRRVDSEILLGRENDFESRRSDEDTRLSRLALGQAMTVGDKDGILDVEESKDNYDAGKAFTPDEDVVDEIPNHFNLEVIVDHAPPKYSLEWEQYEAEQTKGIKAQIKQFFRRRIKRKDPDEDTLFNRFVKTLPEYKRLYAEGKAANDAANKAIRERRKQNRAKNKATGGSETEEEQETKYDPDADSALISFVNDTYDALMNSDSNGHTVVRLNATKYGMPLSSYSFGFYPSTYSGAAGTIAGRVVNPDIPSNPTATGQYDIKYSDYLKAAAKIRGTVGSMRTYSMIGYNCTSFATDIAQSAGVPLKNSDSASYVMTHRHHSQRVDSPYTLARHLIERNEHLEEERLKDPKEIAARAALASKISDLTKSYGQRMNNSPILQIVRKRSLFTDAQINKGISYLIENIVQKGAEIDRDIPVDGLTGDALSAAVQKRINARKSFFDGHGSEEEFLNALSDSEHEIIQAVMDANDTTDFLDLVGPQLEGMGPQFTTKFMASEYFKKHFSSLDRFAGMTEIGMFYARLMAAQIRMSANLNLYMKNVTDLGQYIRNMDSVLGPVELRMLGSRVLDSTSDLEAFMAALNLDAFGKDTSSGPAAKASASPVRPNTSTAPKPAPYTGTVSTTVSEKNEAESTATDSEEPAVAEDMKKVVAEEQSTDSQNADTSEAEDAAAKVAGEVAEAASAAEEATKTASATEETAPAPREIERISVKNVVFAMDEFTATQAFIEQISRITGISGNSVDTGARITRADVARFLYRLHEDPAVNEDAFRSLEMVINMVPLNIKGKYFGDRMAGELAKVPKSLITKILNDLGIE